MDDILSRFSINCHSSIRYAGAMTVWFDPFRVADAPCDADVVFVTHDHYDHFSPEDIHRVMKPDAVLVLPETCVAAALRAGLCLGAAAAGAPRRDIHRERPALHRRARL